MTFQAEFSTNALRDLERLTEQLRAGESKSGAYRSMSEIDNVFMYLGKQLVNNEDLALSVDSEEELVFRTARLIVDTQLDRVERATRSALASQPHGVPTTDVLSRFLATIPIARSELRRITSSWLAHRTADPGALATSDSTARKAAVGVALHELRRMGDIPEIERMLYRGVASKCSEIASACEQILVAIHVHVDLQTARRLWAARRNWERALGR